MRGSCATHLAGGSVRCMIATQEANTSGTDATVSLRGAVFDALCEARGLTTEIAKAEHVGSDRGTLYRIRHRKINPSGELVMRWATRLGVTVEDLWVARGPDAPPPSSPPPAPRPPAGPGNPRPRGDQ